MEDYRCHINHEMQAITKEILGYYHYQDWNPVTAAAALHHYTYHKIPYEERGSSPHRRAFRPPREAWTKGGNCEEKTVFLTSLLKTIPYTETRALAVRSSKPNVDDHLLLQTGFDADSDQITDNVDHFYEHTEVTGSIPDEVSCEHGTRLKWVIADPEMSKHLGDTSTLRRKQYIVRENSTRTWNQVKDQVVL